MQMIQAIYAGGKVSSNKGDAFTLQESQRFGEKKNQKIIYSNLECLYLLEHKKMKIETMQGKELFFEEILKKQTREDKKLYEKYLVFKDLRKRGYIPKTALKFGSDLRVYEGKKSDHAKWVVFVVRESERLTWQDFVAKNRVAHSVKKNVLIAVIDDEESISYFEVAWTKP